MKRIAFAALAATLIAGTAAAEPLKLRISYAGSTPGQFGPILEACAEVPGLYKHYGKSYTIQSVVLRGSGPSLTAVGADELEIGSMSYETLGNGILNAKLDLRVIADVLGTGMNGWGDDYFQARKGEITRIEELKGKVAAVNSRGGAPDTALRHWAAKHGLKHGEDYQVVEMAIPAMIGALDQKKVDLIFTSEPFTGIAERSGKFQPVFSIAQSIGVNQSVIWASKASVIAKHRPIFVDFMEDHIRMRHYLFDMKNREAVLALVSKATKQPVENIDYVFTKRDHWRDPNARADIALLQKNVNDAKTLGLLPDTFDVTHHSDMSIIEDALKRIQ
jgi:ABC-type nitrate/sulfonate/bicarbonate transport system substrate-binding protein